MTVNPWRARVEPFFLQQAFMLHLGATLGNVQRGEVEFHVTRHPNLLQQHGYLHAGVLTSLLDSACGFAAFTTMDDGANVLSVEFKVNLVAPAAGREYLVRGTVLKSGKTLVVCRGDAWCTDDGAQRLVAAMQATMISVPDKL